MTTLAGSGDAPVTTPPVVDVPAQGSAAPPRPGWGSRVRAYVALTKPRIIELLLITTVPAMALAAQGWPGTWLVVATLVGGTLGAGAANVLNCYLDRDIDLVMRRTSRRPLVTAAVPPRAALVFGLLLAVAATAWLWFLVNPLAALVVDAAIVHYVVVYTLGVKRRTAANVFWGGFAGAAPVLTGWAAVREELAVPALLLFAVVFLWQPPHTWALAMRFKEDYARAGVPMLPVVASAARVMDRSVAYTWALVATSLLLVPLSSLGWVYGVAAALTGGWFLRGVSRLRAGVRAGNRVKPMTLFHQSTTYLTVLFSAVLVDALLPF